MERRGPDSDSSAANATLAKCYQALQQRIAIAAGSGPTPRLLAVSKTQGVEAIAALAELGQQDFGENYVQEAIPKIAALPHLCWHFIGPIQSNKTAAIASHFSWVHSLMRADIARRLSQQRPPTIPPLRVLIQVNSSGEASKSGVSPDEVMALAEAIRQLPQLCFKGLMTIPAALQGEADIPRLRGEFATLVRLQQALQKAGVECAELSMGMSADLEIAIPAGASWVRVGSALFGPRPQQVTGNRREVRS